MNEIASSRTPVRTAVVCAPVAAAVMLGIGDPAFGNAEAAAAVAVLVGGLALGAAGLVAAARRGLGRIALAVPAALIVLAAAVLAEQLVSLLAGDASGGAGARTAEAGAALVACAVAASSRLQLLARPSSLLLLGCALVLAAAVVDLAAASPMAVDGSDLIRIAGFAVLLVHAARELRARQIALAVDGERRRLARELHDGVAQELAFIVIQAGTRTADAAHPVAATIAGSAQRGLESVRDAISGLRSPPTAAGLLAALDGEADRASRRWGLRNDLTVEPGVSVSPETEHALVSIVRESLANAGRHGRARRADVRVWSENDRVRLRIADDGCGFDVDAPRTDAGGGLGLLGMTERVQQLGARMCVRSRRGSGTTVDVEVG